MSVEVTYDRNGDVTLTVTDGASMEVGDHLVCPECGTPARYLIAWFTENMVRPVRAYQLLVCQHEFNTREYYLHAELRPGAEVHYEIRPVPEDRNYDPVATAPEKALWTMAGTSESSREIFHMYGGE